MRRAFERVLAARGVTVHRAAEVSRGRRPGACGRATARRCEADEIVWVTQAGGAPWLRDTGLALDDMGFIRVRDTLQSETDPLIFAAGDCAAMIGRPLEKAGVFAVRMAGPLAENLRRSDRCASRCCRYRPQRRWLALISTGDRHAVASRGALYARGDWVWRWKDWIDRRFMRKFSELADDARSRGTGRATRFRSTTTNGPRRSPRSPCAAAAAAPRSARRCCRARWPACARSSATTC